MTEDFRLQALRTARAILNGAVGPIEGCRELVRELYCCGPEVSTHPAALVVRGVESETEAFPIGEGRDLWNPSRLQELDRQLAEYWAQVELEVKAACREIIIVLESEPPALK